MFWIALGIFLLVSGASLLILSFWWYRFSSMARTKRQRLRNLQSLGTAHASDNASAGNSAENLDMWLRRYLPGYHKLEALVVSADTQRPAKHWLGLCTLVFGCFVVTAFVAKLSLIVGMILSAGGGSVPIQYLRHKATKRRTQIEEGLPEALDFLTRALRAGHSLSVAIGMAASELTGPISAEFRQVFEATGFGLPFNECMHSMARRVASQDVDFLVIALQIQRETGGNLTELLDGLSKTIRERIKFKGKVRTLSSEGRFSAMLLGVLPFILGAILSVLNPAYMAPLWSSETGHTMQMAGAGLLVVGFLVLSRLTRIKV